MIRTVLQLCGVLGMTLALQPSIGCKGPSGSRETASSPIGSKDGLRSASGQYVVVYKTAPQPIPLNEPFGIDVTIYDSANQRIPLRELKLDVDGRMPHHRHGMNRQPRISQREDGTFAVEGMLFHMPGRWELYFDITRDGRTERAQDVIFLD